MPGTTGVFLAEKLTVYLLVHIMVHFRAILTQWTNCGFALVDGQVVGEVLPDSRILCRILRIFNFDFLAAIFLLLLFLFLQALGDRRADYIVVS